MLSGWPPSVNRWDRKTYQYCNSLSCHLPYLNALHFSLISFSFLSQYDASFELVLLVFHRGQVRATHGFTNHLSRLSSPVFMLLILYSSLAWKTHAVSSCYAMKILIFLLINMTALSIGPNAYCLVNHCSVDLNISCY